MTPKAADRGNVTVAMLTGIVVLAMTTGVSLAVGLATQTRHRAAAAADAAALAAAAAAIDGASSACALGQQLASRNGATLRRCAVADGIADVTVSVRPPGMLAGFGAVTARARAGPASAAGG